MAKLGWIILGLYVLLGLYVFNLAFDMVALPAFIVSLNKWLTGLAGILLLVGAWFFHKYNKVTRTF